MKHIHLKSLPPKTSHPWCIPANIEIVKKKIEDVSRKVGNYILGANGKMLTSSSTAREVGARVNLLQAVQFAADNWREISSETIQNCFAHSGSKHPRLEMSNTSGIENEATLELRRIRNHEALMQ
jgi:hypothetical protein